MTIYPSKLKQILRQKRNAPRQRRPYAKKRLATRVMFLRRRLRRLLRQWAETVATTSDRLLVVDEFLGVYTFAAMSCIISFAWSIERCLNFGCCDVDACWNFSDFYAFFCVCLTGVHFRRNSLLRWCERQTFCNLSCRRIRRRKCGEKW